jgi:hypothetical protein
MAGLTYVTHFKTLVHLFIVKKFVLFNHIGKTVITISQLNDGNNHVLYERIYKETLLIYVTNDVFPKGVLIVCVYMKLNGTMVGKSEYRLGYKLNDQGLIPGRCNNGTFSLCHCMQTGSEAH